MDLSSTMVFLFSILETLKLMQKYQDWPGIDPKPMDTVKVLEEDDFEVEAVQTADAVVEADATEKDDVDVEDEYLRVIRRKLEAMEKAREAGAVEVEVE